MLTGPAKVKKPQAADPGISFILDLYDNEIPDPLPNLRVEILVADTYKSIVNIENQVQDREMVFSVPFGDTAYASQIGNPLLVSIKAYYNFEGQPSVNILNFLENLPAQGSSYQVVTTRNYLPHAPEASTSVDSLYPSTLLVGEYLRSPANRYICLMEPNGQLSVYSANGDNIQPLWQTPEPEGNPGRGNYFATMQYDGNFCIYGGAPMAPTYNVWNSYQASGGGYTMHPDDEFLSLDDQGELALYTGKGPGDPDKALLYILYSGPDQ